MVDEQTAITSLKYYCYYLYQLESSKYNYKHISSIKTQANAWLMTHVTGRLIYTCGLYVAQRISDGIQRGNAISLLGTFPADRNVVLIFTIRFIYKNIRKESFHFNFGLYGISNKLTVSSILIYLKFQLLHGKQK